MRMIEAKRFFATLIVISGLFWTPVWGANTFELNLHGDRLSLKAEKVPLQQILHRLSESGIKVQIDPAINPQTTASFENRELEEGLKSFLKPLNYILIWQKTDQALKPAGPAIQLLEIQIFKPGEKSRMTSIEKAEEPNENTPEEEQPREEEESAPAENETSVLIKDNRIYVPVTLGYGGREIETSLILDTGAGQMVLHQDIAEQLGIDDFKQARGRGVGGIEIEARATQLDFVRVGPLEKKNLRAAVVVYQGPAEEAYNGLLGMNFLKNFKYEIDFERQVIKWYSPGGATAAGH